MNSLVCQGGGLFMNGSHPYLLVKGQRWASSLEPELGVGTVLDVRPDAGWVQVWFGLSNETRRYAISSAPLRRIHFQPGTTLRTRDGTSCRVQQVENRNGLLYYHTEFKLLCETDLDETMAATGQIERLLSGHLDNPTDFDLRLACRQLQHTFRKSEIHGFVGPGIDLIPHQLSITHEVGNREIPRALLCDEVGLGKTIEACLILHLLLVRGRIQRVLILVPDPLVHQWFVELLRKFHLWFSIHDASRSAAIESSDNFSNPFLDDQWVLCSIDYLASDPTRARQAQEAGWDLLLVDEAHHCVETGESGSLRFQIVRALARTVPGVLLITATPEQAGPATHFALLQILDEARHQDFDQYLKSADRYQRLADVVEHLQAPDRQADAMRPMLAPWFADDPDWLEQQLQDLEKSTETIRNQARHRLLEELLDRHGPGRVLFRNTRARIPNFPKRKYHPVNIPLPSNPDSLLSGSGPKSSGESGPALLDLLRAEFEWDTRFGTDTAPKSGDPDYEYGKDPRILWLVQWLQQIVPEKVLLICRSVDKVLAIEDALNQHLNLQMAVFHEDQTLVQRDRHAAWFAEEDGARLLICSEIGSEGRNFQFVHHLVLFDLPLNAELLEQRIGRLDRIGQRETVHIHVPCVCGSPQEWLARWFHLGLNAFESHVPGANALVRSRGQHVRQQALQRSVPESHPQVEAFEACIEETAQARIALQRQQESGRDRLIEWNSYHPEVAARLIQAIRATDQDPRLEQLFLEIMDLHGVPVEEVAPRTYQVNELGIFSDAFPGLKAGGLLLTFDRQRALGRDTLRFISQDHPMVRDMFDLLLGSERGTVCFAHLPDAETALLLESVHVVEILAPTRWHADRFLPATPIRTVVTHDGRNVTNRCARSDWAGKLNGGAPLKILDKPEFAHRIFPKMIQAAHGVVELAMRPLIEQAKQEIEAVLAPQIHRAQHLRQHNAPVTAREIDELMERQRALEAALENPQVRLDALRLVWKGPL